MILWLALCKDSRDSSRVAFFSPTLPTFPSLLCGFIHVLGLFPLKSSVDN
jgi:hypothetical protein